LVSPSSNNKRLALSTFLLGALAVCILAAQQPRRVDNKALLDPPKGEWLNYGRDYAGTHYSPLDQITASNVKKLGLAWAYDTHSYAGQLEGTPIVSNGTLYATLTWSMVFAIDARTGTEKWRWDPGIPHPRFVTDEHGVKYRRGPSLCCGPVNRGVALYNGKVFVGTLDGRLVALNADTGKEVWTVQTTSKEDDYSITGAPRVVQGKVIVGNSGAEFGVRGFVSAYDTETGKLAWRTFIVPGDPTQPFESKALEAAAKTWNGAWWKYGGGGTAWDGMAYDPELDLLYIGTGNGSPWNRDIRSPGGGDNLYLCSILAVRPETGEYVWHYQTTPADNWDYASVQPLILTDLTINGRRRKVILQAPKNGFFYVIDRVTGEFISAQPFSKVNWATGIDPKTGRPIETPAASYDEQGSMLSPGSDGAHNWHAMAWNPMTGLVYLPAQNTTGFYGRDPDFTHQIGRMNLGRLRGPARPAVAAPPAQPPTAQPSTAQPSTAQPAPPRRRGPGVVGLGGQQEGAFLAAWDPVAQKPRWKIDFEQPGVTGGALSTAGNLVFHGSNDGSFHAYSADRGESLWQVPLAPGFNNPVTFELDGKQYVAVMTGRGGTQAPGRVYAFALDAATPIPTMEPPPGAEKEFELTESAETVAAELAQAGLPEGPGRDLLGRLCVSCHPPAAFTKYRLPAEAWKTIVQQMANRGMPGNEQERQAIVDYLAENLGAAPAAPPR
jgi:quinohemoprotein ethanol dehydrogenase